MGRLTATVVAAAVTVGVAACSGGSASPTTASTAATTTTSTVTAPTTVPTTGSTSTEAPASAGGALLDAVCAGTTRVEVLGAVEPDDLDEISGIAASRRHPGVVWVHDDSGGEAEVSALDETGRRLATVRLDGVEARDWEDIAVGPGPDGGPWIFVGDIGDNDDERDDVAIHRFPEPDLVDGTVAAETAVATYDSGPTDAEALVVDPAGVVWVVAKDGAAPAGVFRLDWDAGTLVRLGELDLGRGLLNVVTGADLSEDGGLAVLRTYTGVWLFPTGAAGMAALPDIGRDGGCYVPVPEELPPSAQGEAVAIVPGAGALLTVSEGEHPDLHRLSPG